MGKLSLSEKAFMEYMKEADPYHYGNRIEVLPDDEVLRGTETRRAVLGTHNARTGEITLTKERHSPWYLPRKDTYYDKNNWGGRPLSRRDSVNTLAHEKAHGIDLGMTDRETSADSLGQALLDGWLGESTVSDSVKAKLNEYLSRFKKAK